MSELSPTIKLSQSIPHDYNTPTVHSIGISLKSVSVNLFLKTYTIINFTIITSVIWSLLSTSHTPQAIYTDGSIIRVRVPNQHRRLMGEPGTIYYWSFIMFLICLSRFASILLISLVIKWIESSFNWPLYGYVSIWSDFERAARSWKSEVWCNW